MKVTRGALGSSLPDRSAENLGRRWAPEPDQRRKDIQPATGHCTGRRSYTALQNQEPNSPEVSSRTQRAKRDHISQYIWIVVVRHSLSSEIIDIVHHPAKYISWYDARRRAARPRFDRHPIWISLGSIHDVDGFHAVADARLEETQGGVEAEVSRRGPGGLELRAPDSGVEVLVVDGALDQLSYLITLVVVEKAGGVEAKPPPARLFFVPIS